MRTLYLRGEDVGSQTYWAWEWSDGSEPQFAVQDREGLAPLLGQLDAALPGLLPAEIELTREELLERIDKAEALPEDLRPAEDAPDMRLREVLMVHRCMTGALAHMDSEGALAELLGSTLLPSDLVSGVRACAKEFGPEGVELRIMPARSCARVPWELLSLGADGTRLLDLARVVTMAPLLGRDGDPSVPHPSWEMVKDQPVLYVIDPLLTHRENERVLDPRQAAKLRHQLTRREQADELSVQSLDVDRDWLSEMLHAPRSRFMYLGHVTASEATAGKTALRLNDHARRYGLGGRHGAHRDLTAQDLLAGTVGREKVLGRLSHERGRPLDEALREEFGGQPLYPSRALSGEYVTELPGRELWPMPPRVALIACGSGIDLGHTEPFGLVTAVLENGAELVTATRWTLLADRVFSYWGIDATPLRDMTVAVDSVHSSSDPLADLAVWQRERLERWRQTGSLSASPISWAALANFWAPDRTPRPGAQQ